MESNLDTYIGLDRRKPFLKAPSTQSIIEYYEYIFTQRKNIACGFISCIVATFHVGYKQYDLISKLYQDSKSFLVILSKN